MSKNEFNDLLIYFPPWQNEVVKGLREVRRKIKQLLATDTEPSRNIENFREKVAVLELEAEKIEQTMLSRLAKNYSAGERSRSASKNNLLKYTSLITRELDKPNISALTTLLDATFTNDTKTGDST